MQQGAVGFVGAVIFAFGVLTLLGGRQYYSNYWGGAVFAPFALGVGGLCCFVALLKRNSRPANAAGSQANEGRHKRPAVMRRHQDKISRNAPCRCGSGLKYKHCCLSKDEERDWQEHELNQRPSVDVMEGPATTFRRAFDRPWKPPKA